MYKYAFRIVINKKLRFLCNKLYVGTLKYKLNSNKLFKCKQCRYSDVKKIIT